MPRRGEGVGIDDADQNALRCIRHRVQHRFCHDAAIAPRHDQPGVGLEVAQADGDFRHQGRDVVAVGRVLGAAHDVDQHRSDELAGRQCLLDLRRPVGEPGSVRRPIEQVVVDGAEEGADLGVAGARRMGEERVDVLAFVADAERAGDVGEQGDRPLACQA